MAAESERSPDSSFVPDYCIEQENSLVLMLHVYHFPHRSSERLQIADTQQSVQRSMIFCIIPFPDHTIRKLQHHRGRVKQCSHYDSRVPRKL